MKFVHVGCGLWEALTKTHMRTSADYTIPHCTLWEVDFWIFWIFNFFKFAIDGENNSKTKVEKVFFFIFMRK
jgi:hypothetical protein